MRANALKSADPDVRGRADRGTSQAQIARFGATSCGHPANEVAGHIESSVAKLGDPAWRAAAPAKPAVGPAGDVRVQVRRAVGWLVAGQWGWGAAGRHQAG
jgi:hypothetical protein